WRSDAVVVEATPLGHGDEPRLDQLGKVLACGRTRDAREECELASGQGLTAHERGQHRGTCGVSDERCNLDHICGRDHDQTYSSAGAPRKQGRFGTCRTVKRGQAALSLPDFASHAVPAALSRRTEQEGANEASAAARGAVFDLSGTPPQGPD